jgi:hypothetical protein
MESHFSLLGDNVSIGARYAWFAPNVPSAQKSFCKHLMVLLGDEAQLESRFHLFADSVNLDAR